MDNGLWEYYDINLQANSIQVDAARSGYGYQPHTLDQIVIVNAGDLSDVTTACYYKPDGLVGQQMQTQFDGVKNVLYIRPLATTKFSDIHVIYFSGANDVNMCANSQASHTFDYQIVDGVIPDLKTQQV
jgi:hypothetical protein